MSDRDTDDEDPTFDSVSDTAGVRQRRRTRRARRSLRVPVDEVPRRRSGEIEALPPPVVKEIEAAPEVDVPIELTPTGVALPPPAPGEVPLPDDEPLSDEDELASVATTIRRPPSAPPPPAEAPAAAAAPSPAPSPVPDAPPPPRDDPDAVVVVRRAVRMVKGSEVPPPPQASVIEVPTDAGYLRDPFSDTDPGISIAALDAVDIELADESLRGDLDPTDRTSSAAAQLLSREQARGRDASGEAEPSRAGPPSGEVARALAEVDVLARHGEDDGTDTIEPDALLDEAEAGEQEHHRPRTPPPPPQAPAAHAPPKPPPAAAHAPPPPPVAALAQAVAAVPTQEPSESRPRRKRARIWFEDFFNDDYLRTVRPPKEAQVIRHCSFIEQSLALATGATILDVGCGLGLHAIELTTRGYAVVGLDLSLPMLSRAGEEAQDRGLKMNFLHGDMREMSFDGSFDAVLCLGTTFGYFDDETNKQVLSRMYRALKPMGLMMLDVVNRDFVVRNQPNLVWFEGDGCVCMEETFFNYITSRLHVKRTVILEDGRQRENEYTIRLYSLHELGQLLHHMGFRVAEVSGREATPGVFFGADSPRMIILAERRASVGEDERTPGPITAAQIAIPGSSAPGPSTDKDKKES